ncbi:MAG: hypothetical protein ABEI77_04055 [Halorientalis sp.]
MTRKTSSEADDSTEQSDTEDVSLNTVKEKAREALKHNQPEKDCDVTVRTHISDYDSGRKVTDHLIQTDDEWIACITWSEIGGGTGIAVEDHGETLRLEAPKLDRDIIADRVCSEALDAIDAHEEVGWPVKPFTTLIRNASDVADDLVPRWQTGSEIVVKERIYEGVAGWTGNTAWVAHDGEAIYVETARAVSWFIDEHASCDVSGNVEATIQGIFMESLYDAVADYRGRRTPHLQYAAEVTLTD